MHQDLHDIHVALEDALVVWFVGQQDKLDSQQRDEDEGGSDRPHVQAGFSLVGHPQLGHQNTHDVEQKEKVDLLKTPQKQSVNTENSQENSQSTQLNQPVPPAG